MGVTACFLGSAQRDPSVLARVRAGQYSVVYCTPEYASNSRKVFASLKGGSAEVMLVAVDEVRRAGVVLYKLELVLG